MSMAVERFLPALGVIAGLAILGFLYKVIPWGDVWEAIVWLADNWLAVLLGIVAAAIGIAAGIAVISGLVWLDKTGRMKRGGQAFAKPFRIAWEGIKAIKYRTCPTVEVQ